MHDSFDLRTSLSFFFYLGSILLVVTTSMRSSQHPNKRLVQIRVLSVQRVTNGFNARSMCARRTYAYFLPMSILEPIQRDIPLYPTPHEGV